MKTELFEPATFLHWTDGPKIILDFHDVIEMYQSGMPKDVICIQHNYPIELVKLLAEDEFAGCTFWVNSSDSQAEALERMFPTRDIRRLVLT